MSEKPRICFVLDIVRSPLAQYLFINVVKKAGGDHKYEVDSAGTTD